MRRTAVWPTLGLVAICLASGCATVTADKSGRGIPFNTPQPYLVVTRSKKPPIYGTRTTETIEDGKVKRTVTEPCMLFDSQIETTYAIVYLPNLSDRYWLRMEAGLGAVQSDVAIADGWRLTGVKASADSKTAENVKSIAEVLGAATGLGLTRGAEQRIPIEIYRLRPDGTFELVFTAKSDDEGAKDANTSKSAS
ncbi:MAG: hypothetical protein U0572_12345 [Phycisphaerales bacterium]